MSLFARDTDPSCYALSGAKAPFEGDTLQYSPCNHTALAAGQHSACCAPTDLCLSNGLCKYNNPDPTVAPFNEYWRIGCTDPTYKDPACPKQCEEVGGANPGESRLVFLCPGTGKWCCGTGALKDYAAKGTVNTTCCDQTELLFFEDKQAIVYTTAEKVTLASSKETLTSSAATQTPMTTDAGSGTFQSSVVGLETAPSSTSTTTSTTSTPSNAIAYGVGFGVGIPLLTCILLALFYLIQRHRRLNHERHTPIGAEPSPDDRTKNPHAYMAEPGGRELPVELETKKDPVEIWTPPNPSAVRTSDARKEEHGWEWDGADARDLTKRSNVVWEQVHGNGYRGSDGNR